MNDEIRDTGMAIAGIRVALNDLKKTHRLSWKLLWV